MECRHAFIVAFGLLVFSAFARSQTISKPVVTFWSPSASFYDGKPSKYATNVAPPLGGDDTPPASPNR